MVLELSSCGLASHNSDVENLLSVLILSAHSFIRCHGRVHREPSRSQCTLMTAPLILIEEGFGHLWSFFTTFMWSMHGFF